ncbi:hypothetical protein SBBP2_2350001 [Burkholderiales bacterium]|nr:hypothetical protein SBBP2_2350001 [Burkholderiales bacterium]
MPIIVLSARTAEAGKIAALDAGADDYLTKPFGAGELLARVRAQLRRQYRSGTAVQNVYEFGAIRLDLGKRMAWRDGEPLHLTPIEYRLLAFLVAHPDCVLTRRYALRSHLHGPPASQDRSRSGTAGAPVDRVRRGLPLCPVARGGVRVYKVFTADAKLLRARIFFVP